MSFDGSDFLLLAQELAGKKQGVSTEEARLRSAISRAYYAAFLEARRFLRKRGTRITFSSKAHDDVINTLLNDADPNYQSLGADLDLLRTLRRQADYGDSFTGLAVFTSNALKLAESIIKTLAT
jgi:uncharacterized protein (UPF0332 family)